MLSLNQLDIIPRLLTETNVIAVVGLSPKPERPSNTVADYLIRAGYDVIPVNPGQEKILGRKCYPDLLSIPGKVDIVNIFRKSEDVGPVVDQALEIGCKGIWMQLGVINHAAAQKASEQGIPVIMDRCIKIDHHNLFQPNR